MSMFQSAGKSTSSLPYSQGASLLIFAATLFLSALLLFGVQPMFAKMVLPKLGGSPAVWSVALVFFQAVLLLGYGYAHALTRWLAPRTAVLAHMVTLSLALLCLPIAYPANWVEAPETGQVFWVLGLFAAGVGFPFFAVSANAPLLQSWFSRIGHTHSADPYFLYGASNIGSFIALFMYPFVLEPLLSLQAQSFIWSLGYVGLAGMILLCGFILRSRLNEPSGAPAAGQTAAVTAAGSTPSWKDRGAWIALSMVPSGLLVGVTAYITTDLAAAPFLWVVPLALFLLTFVITFQRRPVLAHDTMLKLQAAIMVPAVIIMFSQLNGLYMIPLHLAVFFICTMVCHGELVQRRPASEHLTEFYLWMSFGGVMGGLFASLIAPHVFTQVLEYPILVVAAYFCRHDIVRALKSCKWTQLQPFLLVLLLFAGLLSDSLWELVRVGVPVLILLLAVYALVTRLRHGPVTDSQPLKKAALVAAGTIFVTGYLQSEDTIHSVRSFFGVNSVVTYKQGRYHTLVHGSTVHGAERRLNDDGTPVTAAPEPLTYYYRGGSLDAGVDAVRRRKGGLDNVGVIGLGSGAMACHRRPGETWRFFEIDPEVVRLARNPRLFRFLDACGESGGIVIGDGRITLEREPEAKFDVIVLDAFSSDSIPAHLLTTEAMRLYFSRLKPDGALVFHISNRYMELSSVVSAVARDVGAVAYISRRDRKMWKSDLPSLKVMAQAAVVARSREHLGSIQTDPRWLELRDDELSPPWSDDYSNIIGAIYRTFTTGLVPARANNEEE